MSPDVIDNLTLRNKCADDISSLKNCIFLIVLREVFLCGVECLGQFQAFGNAKILAKSNLPVFPMVTEAREKPQKFFIFVAFKQNSISFNPACPVVSWIPIPAEQVAHY